jgi:serine/threonine protein phosphatase PrpC
MNRNDYKYRIVAASDGLWDMMSNAEVKGYIEFSKGKDLQLFCKRFVKHTRAQWTEVTFSVI